jgi:hypothetical protein
VIAPIKVNTTFEFTELFLLGIESAAMQASLVFHVSNFHKLFVWQCLDLVPQLFQQNPKREQQLLVWLDKRDKWA